MNARQVAAATAAAAFAVSGAAGAGTASAASTYVASSMSTTPTLSGGPFTLAAGSIVVRCTTGLMSVSTLPLAATALPATVNSPFVLTNCAATMGGIPRPVSVATPGPINLAFGTANYSAGLVIPAGGLFATIGNCKITVSAPSTVSGSLRDAAGVAPVLGAPATRLALGGAVPVVVTATTPLPVCPTATSATITADGSVVAGVTTGTFAFGGSITEN